MTDKKQETLTGPPLLVEEYTDTEMNFKGWFVRDTLDYAICAGGMRVQPGLTREHLSRMARNMTLKMRISGLCVDGAKSGIDFDPASPDKDKAVAGFLAAIRPYVESSYSMGPDLNMEMAELNRAARSLGIPSVKMAVAGAQGWDLPYYLERAAILEQKVDGWTVGSLRAGHGVAAAALAVLDSLRIPCERATAAIQGFGTLARAAALGLSRAGVSIIALADQEKSLLSPDGGLDIELLARSGSPLLPAANTGHGTVGKKEDILNAPCDILIPAAVENTVNGDNCTKLRVRAVVPGANLGVSRQAEKNLSGRGILVLPDFLVGCGGSLSMEGLFAPRQHPTPQAVLDHVHARMIELVKQILTRSKAENISPTAAALRFCRERKRRPGAKPYGNDKG